MANKNFGRRMVDEESITKIGKGGGGGTPIEAGTGISITGTDTKTISVDNTVALKTDVKTYAAGTGITIDSTTDTIAFDTENYQLIPIYDYSTPDFTDVEIVQIDGQDYLDVSNVMNSIPVLHTSSCTDFDQLPNPKIDAAIDSDDQARKQFYFKGVCMIKNTATNTYYLISTWQSVLLKWGQAIDTTKRCLTKQFLESSQDGYFIKEVKPNKFEQVYFATAVQNVNGLVLNGNIVPRENFLNIRLSPGEFTDTNLNGSGIKGVIGHISFDYNNILQPGATLPNYGDLFRIPTTEGNYVLSASVNSSGAATPGWSAPQVASPVYEYAVYFTFEKTGTGAAYYSVYFTLKSTTEYIAQDINFATLRNMIIANGNHVSCNCQSQGTLDMNQISTSTNAGDDTILVDSKSSDFFEFYSFNDLQNYSITKLTY